MTTHTDQPRPQAGSKAWQRFLKLVQEHFETVCWNDADGRPRLVSLVDLASGEALTLAPLDALDTDPAAVLAVSADDCPLSARGPLAGPAAANDLAVRLAQSTDGPAAVACPAVLHPPDQPRIPDDLWVEVPEPIGKNLWAARPVAGATPAVLVLVDLPTTTMAVIGPFDTTADAEAWAPQPPPDHLVDRLVVALT